MKRVFIDIDNVLVDFQSGLDLVSEDVKAELPDGWIFAEKCLSLHKLNNDNNMNGLSKSRYTAFSKCPKNL